MKGKFSKRHDREILYGRRSRKEGQECEIIGETKDGNCFKVLWPGSRTPSIYHKSFIDIIEQNPPATGSSSETMFRHLSGQGIGNHSDSHPYDPDDFRRCSLLLKAVPQWKNDLHKLKGISLVWSSLVDNWDKLTEMLEAAMASPNKEDAEMYEFMKKLGC